MEFNQLVKTHSGKIKKIISSNVNNKNDHDDIYQEVLIKLWKYVSEFKGESSLSTWIHTVATNTIKDYFRDNFTPPTINVENLNPKNLPRELKDLDDAYFQLERIEVISKMNEDKEKKKEYKSKHRDKYDKIIKLKGKFTATEISNALDIPVGTVLSIWNRFDKGKIKNVKENNR